MEGGADTNKLFFVNKTPLYIACQYGHDDIVKHLVETVADINIEEAINEINLNNETLLLKVCTMDMKI